MLVLSGTAFNTATYTEFMYTELENENTYT